jgi:pullulanase
MDSKADIERNLEIISAEDSAVSFILKINANGDSWTVIFVAYNSNSVEKIFRLPADGTWRQTVNGVKAGVDTLAEISGNSVSLPPFSMAVLHNEGTGC